MCHHGKCLTLAKTARNAVSGSSSLSSASTVRDLAAEAVGASCVVQKTVNSAAVRTWLRHASEMRHGTQSNLVRGTLALPCGGQFRAGSSCVRRAARTCIVRRSSRTSPRPTTTRVSRRRTCSRSCGCAGRAETSRGGAEDWRSQRRKCYVGCSYQLLASPSLPHRPLLALCASP